MVRELFKINDKFKLLWDVIFKKIST